MADYYDVNGNKLSSVGAAQPGEIYRDVNGKILAPTSSIPTQNEIGRHLVEGLPMGGSVAGTALGGPLGGAAGTLLGTIIKQKLKEYKPELVGEAPGTGEDSAADFGKELLLNNVLPEGLGKAIRLGTKMSMQGPGRVLAESMPGMPAVREGMAKEIGQNIQSQLADHYQPLGDYQPISVKPTSVDYQPIKITPGQEAKPVRKGQRYQPQTQPSVIPSGPMRQVPSGEFQVVPGEVQAAQDKLGKLVTKDKLDASKTLEELTGPNASQYADAMPTDTYQNVKKLLETMKGLQEKGKADMVLNYSKHKLLWSGAGLVTGGLTGSALGHPIAGALIGGTPMVLNGILDRVMANPETAKLVTLALTTPAKAPQAALINKALSEALPRLFQAGADIAATPDR